MNLNDIFFVIVLYKSSLEDSKTISSLSSIVDKNINLLVFDNSPIKQYENVNFQFKNFIIHYFHDETNPGLSAAYNLALDESSKLNKKWLLLLDQDTTFTIEYIKEIESLELNALSNTVVAIIPRVFSLLDKRIIAPVKMYLGGICRPVDIDNGVIKTKISGINSGTILNVFYLNSINGFSKKYNLDMLDHWYFRRLFKNGKSVYLMKSQVYHELSVFGNFEENVTIDRYKQMLQSEYHFLKEDGIFSLLIFKFRLFFRFLKQLKYNNSDYYKYTLSKIF